MARGFGDMFVRMFVGSIFRIIINIILGPFRLLGRRR